MRWLLAGALAVSLVACGESTLGPTSTLDGVWAGTTPGYQLSMTLTQTDTLVTGTALLAGVAGFAEFEVTGTLRSHTVALIAIAPGFEPVKYDGTLSTTEAVINGRLDGSGFNKLQMNLKKR
jgi:hypothetical protein